MKNPPQSDYEQFEQSSTQSRRMLRQEELILDVTETFCEAMDRDGANRKQLAEALGKTRGFVSQLLNGGRNLTLRTVADVADALGYIVQFRMVKVMALKTTHAPDVVSAARGKWRSEPMQVGKAAKQGSADEWATEIRKEGVIRIEEGAEPASDNELCLT
ncbi:MAG TPA: helix-turn-helix transcriptional regulator [Gemmatimonadaceae bacterium]|nr:helix-turn-helix transcriptional regulator [Gemmatimonadaceae bacterium]